MTRLLTKGDFPTGVAGYNGNVVVTPGITATPGTPRRMQPSVGLLRPDDLQAAADLFASAFHHDPLMQYVLPDPSDRLLRLPWLEKHCCATVWSMATLMQPKVLKR
jgi:hypothetical protein